MLPEHFVRETPFAKNEALMTDARIIMHGAPHSMLDMLDAMAAGYYGSDRYTKTTADYAMAFWMAVVNMRHMRSSNDEQGTNDQV